MTKKKKIIIAACILLIIIIAAGIIYGIAHRKNDESNKSGQPDGFVTDSDLSEDEAEESGDSENDEDSDNSYDDYDQPENIVLDDDPTTKDYDNGIEFDEEIEGAELLFKKTEASKFYGSWESTSGQSEYFYGGIDITVRSDNTWRGTITGEPFSGAWVTKDGGIYLSSEVFSCSLKFTDTGRLILQQDYGEENLDPVAVVLTKK